MALNNKQRLTLIAVGVALAAATVLAYDGYRIYQVARFNDALERNALSEAAEHGSLQGRFAGAYQLQQQNRFQEALKAYGALMNAADGRLRQAISFNLANLYLRQGITMVADEQQDLAIPLIELAKETYREILRNDSGHWDAKYNLERALALLPDVAAEEAAEEFNPEHSSRAIVSIRTRRELP